MKITVTELNAVSKNDVDFTLLNSLGEVTYYNDVEYEDLPKVIGDSDAVIVKGIISMLISVLSQHTPDEILTAELYFIDRIGLSEHLSPTRSNGLVAMVKQMKMYALAFKAKQQTQQ